MVKNCLLPGPAGGSLKVSNLVLIRQYFTGQVPFLTPEQTRITESNLLPEQVKLMGSKALTVAYASSCNGTNVTPAFLYVLGNIAL